MREVLKKPSNFYFNTNDKVLMFDEVSGADYYTIQINGREKIKTTENSYNFDLDYGTYEFEVQAFGDFDIYKQSSVETFEATVFTGGVLSLIEGLKGYGKSANRR